MARAGAHIVVSGYVQGVFFRESTRRLAESLGVTGWVRNLVDGRVDIRIEGERDCLEQVVAWCERGPMGAEVDDVSVEWLDYSGEFGRFAIHHG